MIMVTSWSVEENHCFLMRAASSGYLVAGDATRALEIAEGGAAARIDEPWIAASECCGRVMDLRDVVHRRDAVVELAERAEQLVDVHVLAAGTRGRT